MVYAAMILKGARMTYTIGKVTHMAHVSDSRFTATYDKVRPGLAMFLRDAINIYCTENAT